MSDKSRIVFVIYFYFKDPATTEINTYGHTLSLHDALPIWLRYLDKASGAGRVNNSDACSASKPTEINPLATVIQLFALLAGCHNRSFSVASRSGESHGLPRISE